MIHPRFAIKGDKEILRRTRLTWNYYMDVSDEGGARFSEPAARVFREKVVTAILTGKYDSRFSDMVAASTKLQTKSYMDTYNKGTSEPWGKRTGTMANQIEVFRSSFGGDRSRRGYVVGVRPQDGYYKDSRNKLKWFEFGTKRKGPRGGPQRPRPIIQLSLEDFLLAEFPHILGTLSKKARKIWGV